MLIMGDWGVKLAVSGAIGVKSKITMNVEKGFDNPFWTTVTVTNAPRNILGVIIEIIAKANTQQDANNAAVFFAGQMLDVLCLHTKLPLYLSLEGLQFRKVEANAIRYIESHQWREAFRVGRDYGLNRPTFIRALSWYRKGLTSEDPIDRFLAFWSSIEGISSRFSIKTERTKKGVINQICDCFDQLWGDVKNWKIIPNDALWLLVR